MKNAKINQLRFIPPYLIIDSYQLIFSQLLSFAFERLKHSFYNIIISKRLFIPYAKIN